VFILVVYFVMSQSGNFWIHLRTSQWNLVVEVRLVKIKLWYEIRIYEKSWYKYMFQNVK
jgi:hypothetical protein